MADIPEDAYRAFATPVALITTRDARGPNVMAAEWTYQVSYEPFLILIALAPGEATYDAILATEEFGVNLCSEEQAPLSTLAGHFTKRETDKLSSELFETYPASTIQAPLIKGCILNAECRLVDRFPAGDHVAFVGEVVAATWNAEKRPLVLHRGYRRISDRMATGEALSATVTPMRAARGARVSIAGEYRSPGSRAGKAVAVEVLGPSGAVVGNVSGKTDGDGYYDIAWTVPADARPGPHAVVAVAGDAEGRARLLAE